MRFFTLSVAAALCGLAASLTAGEAPLYKRTDFCGRRPEFDYCEISGKYVVCDGGKPTFYTCDGGCKPLCHDGTPCFKKGFCADNQPCVARCDNGKLSGPPSWAH
ncbi:uncharacterized protein MCYG_02907 [Microsporum canis CBS 113480]|uniref:Uncharacterized protein n=1 Tax=Arthroderma otae (strain ATCC MYA-4605 / CBS 113480) TaxID=554155 RepID=C5FK66_ARTOC|nr:uncharacterized protein MCYG_02907 [Microsporum canis CBS 113480]EEQ30088.1 predicted protein [Microsporum canis CBS 113480]